MSIKVSVVMPVYNAQKYLKRSIESILNQTLKEIELILVNDGSKDHSIDICREYEQKDYRVKVVDKKNEGACIARNTGIQIAKGEYLQLVDADDYCELNMLEEQYALAKSTNAEVVMCGLKYDISLKNGQILYEEDHYQNAVLTGKQEIKEVMMDIINNMLFNYTHNKLYNLNFLKENNLKFTEWLPIDQDTNFNIDVFKHLNHLTLTKKSYYHYIKTFEETIVNRYHPEKFKVRTYRYERLIDMFKEFGIYTEENKKQLASIYIHQVIECFEMYFHEKCPLTPKEKKQQIKEILQIQTVQLPMTYVHQGKSRFTNLVLKSMKFNNSFFIYNLAKFKNLTKQ
ncbi:glycosyltransferase family 2 protein [Turicibacter bilis]|uniref:glycosyltransferase family 2 protein n=1 Tax=Turicibacter bilis TaxID=2735723 RepID=UPI001BAF3BCF|nr:glycosyltransferase family 2 protein [Turicibacter bilis]MBS3203743.1 glycosyltransferase family 2 protein [Turicibacter bilis]UUF11106.1 glycosyltransferase family 2 protein [Turicibacter bilis]